MLDQYIQNVRLAALVFPFVAALLFIPVWALHRRIYGELHEYRATISALFLFYLIAAGLFTVLPLQETASAVCKPRVELTPFASFVDVGRYAERKGLGWSIGDMMQNYAFLQIALNFLLLLPFGVFVRALFRTSFLETLVLAFLVSLFFETTQLTGVWWLYDCPWRVFTVDDLIVNTAGAGLGWLLWNVFFHIVPDPSAPEREMWYRRGRQVAGK